MSEHITPKVGCSVIVYDEEGKILLGNRKGSHGANTWAFPGGHMEMGETPEQCVARELFQETGLTAKEFLHCNPSYTNDIFSKDLHYITLYLVCHSYKGELTLKEPDKCSEWRWCEWENLPKPLFLPLENLKKLMISTGMIFVGDNKPLYPSA